MAVMTAERWQQIERLYHAARERDAANRAPFLAEACRGDDALRREVESLLASNEDAGSFMDAPAAALEAVTIAGGQAGAGAQRVGRSFSHYRIVSRIGAGGMGEVWLAEDTTLHRKVAVKLLLTDFTTNADRVRRFGQ